MDRTERFYKIDKLLQARRVVPLALLLQELGVSRATLKRDLEYLRERLHAPIVWDRAAGGYRYAAQAGGAQQLPGLWLNASEAYALLMMQALLQDMQPGLLARHIEPLQERLRRLIEAGEYPIEDVQERIRVLRVGVRSVSPRHFELVAGALLRRRRLDILYFARGRGARTQREVSPQRLIHHRGNWYLVAWCHHQQALRSFALDAVEQARESDRPARVVARKTLDDFIGQGYGIFSGQRVRWATLRFTPERARWVQQEVWHPRQRSRLAADGALLLELPYTDPRELLMDVLRHGRHVEVLAPAELRQAVAQELHAACQAYTHRTVTQADSELHT